MAIAEKQPIVKNKPSRRGEIAARVMLTAGLAFPGAGLYLMGRHNLPAIDKAIVQDDDIIDSLAQADQSASFTDESTNIGGRTFSRGVRPPNMELVRGEVKVARLQVKIKGGSQQIVDDLQQVEDTASDLGRIPGDTKGIQETMTRDASQFNDEVRALQGRQKLNLAAKFGGLLLGLGYPSTVGAGFALEKARQHSEKKAKTQSQEANRGEEGPHRSLWQKLISPSPVRAAKQTSEHPRLGAVDEREPGWMAEELIRKNGTLLPPRVRKRS